MVINLLFYCRQVFVGLYIKDPRLVLGADYFKDPLYEVRQRTGGYKYLDEDKTMKGRYSLATLTQLDSR